MNRHFCLKGYFTSAASYAIRIKAEPTEHSCKQDHFSRSTLTSNMDATNDASSYVKMISDAHSSNNSPVVYTCTQQPTSFHCVKGYRQLAYDSMAAYESVPPQAYSTIKQEPVDYAACENPYDQGILSFYLGSFFYLKTNFAVKIYRRFTFSGAAREISPLRFCQLR